MHTLYVCSRGVNPLSLNNAATHVQFAKNIWDPFKTTTTNHQDWPWPIYAQGYVGSDWAIARM